MEKTKIMNIEEQDNGTNVTDVTYVEADETKDNNDFALGALAGVGVTLAVAGVAKLVKWGVNKAKAKKNESKKQTKDVKDADFVVLETDDEETEN